MTIHREYAIFKSFKMIHFLNYLARILTPDILNFYND